MKAVIDMGKIDYYNRGRKTYPVEIDIELRDDNGDKPVLAISATVWNHLKTNFYLDGQCLDDLYTFFKEDSIFQKLYNWWKLYHLNNMHAGTPEQEQALAKVNLLNRWGVYYQTVYSNSNITPEQLYTEERMLNVSKYEIACKYLKSIGLYEVSYEGNRHKYGCGWIYYPIPEQTLQEIKQFIADANSVLASA